MIQKAPQKTLSSINKTTSQRGMTLIEVSLYTVLVSVLMTTTISFLYAISIQQAKLNGDIQDAFLK